ncbi:MAG: nicotinate-nucleotide adenylyltransferase [bacterium]|jgi:nicotinate-nucleotide adenylyltransferase
MKLGLFGGSFSPVHLGHYEIVKQVLQQGLVDRVIIIPAFQNPLKTHLPLPHELRWEMLEVTFQDLDNSVIFSDYEIQRKGESYSIDTISFFKKNQPDDELFFIMGADSLYNFDQWKEYQKILQISKLLVFQRADVNSSTSLSSSVKNDQVVLLDIQPPNISSTKIREASLQVALDKPWLHQDCHPIWAKYQNSIKDSE